MTALSQRKKTFITLFMVVVALALVVGFGKMVKKNMALMGFSHNETKNFPADEGDVAVVEIEGIIDDSHEAVESFEELADIKSIKAVVIRINSPGGTVGASQEIYEGILKLREKKKAVVCSLGDIAASGGYYAAAACQKIIANPGTLTGSIGVIMQFMNVAGLYSWARIDPYILKAGRYKDIGSELRPMSPEERAMLQELLDDTHRKFMVDVSVGRKFKNGYIEEYADGRILTGRQAKDLGFVDELGGESLAIFRAAEMAGIKGKPTVVRESLKKDRIRRFLEGKSGASTEASALAGLASRLLPQVTLQPGVPYLLPPVWFSGWKGGTR